MREGWTLAVKSHRSAGLILASWGFGRICAWIRGDLRKLTNSLVRWGVLPPADRATGFIAYEPRDHRNRTYTIVRATSTSLFLKSGTDLRNEFVPESVKTALIDAGFEAQVPLQRLNDTGIRVNVYRYVDPRKFTKSRLSESQICAFVEALNRNAVLQTAPLPTVLAAASPNPRARAILEHPAVQNLCRKMRESLVTMGCIHGDLMSANILRGTDATDPVVVLDWESLDIRGPLIIDLIGGLEWSKAVQRAQAAWAGYTTGAPAVAEDQHDALVFMVIAVARNFRPAIAWLERTAAKCCHYHD